MARCEDAPCCGCCPSSEELYYDSREDIDFDPWSESWAAQGDEEMSDDGEPSGSYDLSDDADALASAGWGTDEDYGYYGDDC